MLGDGVQGNGIGNDQGQALGLDSALDNGPDTGVEVGGRSQRRDLLPAMRPAILRPLLL